MTVNSFCDFIEMHISNIVNLGSNIESFHQIQYQKMLLFPVIELLAHIDKPDMSSKQRVISCIHEYGNWPNARRICQPELLHDLEVTNPNLKETDSNTRALITDLRNSISQWKDEGPIPLSIDPEIVHDYKKAYEYQHCCVFYRFRNSLMHEFNHKGMPEFTGFDNEPYYIPFAILTNRGRDGLQLKRTEYHIVYPIGFFVGVIRSILVGLQTIDNIQERLNDYVQRNSRYIGGLFRS